MFITVITYLIPVLQIGLPGYLLYRLWKTNVSSQVEWALSITYLAAVLIFWFVIGRWDIAGYGFRYWGYALMGIGTAFSYRKVKNKPVLTEDINWPWWKLLETVFITVFIIWSVSGYFPDKDEVALEFPLKGQSFYVAQGGAFPLINYHGLASKAQKYALDITQLNSWGFRSTSLLPGNPSDYKVFGTQVVSPVSGTIISETDSLADQSPPRMKPKQPAGNHIWIRRGNLYILLAHLRQGSICVEKGQQVKAGTPVAQVGNTGNTSEPHLHIHAIRLPSDSLESADKEMLGRGNPVPIEFKDEFLVRNDVISSQD